MSGRTFSQTIITGFLGNDPELSYMPSGDPVLNLNVSTYEEWIDKQTGEIKKVTEWHRIVLTKRNAENAAKYTRKGSLVLVIGSNRTTKYQDKKTGEDRYSNHVQGRTISFLEKKPTDNSSDSYMENLGDDGHAEWLAAYEDQTSGTANS